MDVRRATDTRTARRSGAPRCIEWMGSPAAAAAIDCRRSRSAYGIRPPAEGRGQHECERGKRGQAESKRCGSGHFSSSIVVVGVGGPHDAPVSRSAGGPGRRHSDECDYGHVAEHPPSPIRTMTDRHRWLCGPGHDGARRLADGPILRPMDDPRLLETTIGSRVIHTGRYLTVRVDTIRDADGVEHTRDIVEHPGAVAILALDQGEVLMVLQYRTPTGLVLMRDPGGDPGTRARPGRGRPRDRWSTRARRRDGIRGGELAAAGQLLHSSRIRERVHAPLPGHRPVTHRRIRRSRRG